MSTIREWLNSLRLACVQDPGMFLIVVTISILTAALALSLYFVD